MSDPDKRADAVAVPDGPVAAHDTLNSAADDSLLSRLPEEAAANDNLRFLSAPEATGELGRLAGYRILRVLGQGGMGMVLEAEDVRLKRSIAIKVMKPEVAAKETHRRRFLREAQAAAAVESDYIIPIHQIGEENGVAFIAMPFLKGESLEARMMHGRLHVPELLQIGRQIAEGLAAAHSQSLVHRDIKPANVWLEKSQSIESFRVKILDFGLARLSEDDVRLTQSGAIIGTPAYMAPEQARGQEVDHRADLFSLGVLLYEMATGRRPFTGENTMAILTSLALDTPAPPSELNPDLPPNFSQLVMRLLEKNPAKRFQNAVDVVDVLRRLQPENTVGVIATSQPKLNSKWKIASSATNKAVSPLAVSRSEHEVPLAVTVELFGRDAEASEPSAPDQEPRGRPSEGALLRDASASRQTKNRNPVRWLLVGATVLGVVALIIVLMNRGQNDSPTDTSGKVNEVKKGAPKKESPIIATKDDSPLPVVKGIEISFDLGNDVKLDVVKINAKGKKFLMGSPKDEEGRDTTEIEFDKEEQHEVSFADDWYMGKFEVTQEQYEAIMGTKPTKINGTKYPVEMVSWNDAQNFLKKLNEKFKNRRVAFRLPSESEWEYACRAGTSTAYNFGKEIKTEQANFKEGANSGASKPVGSYQPNAFGLFDMHGNVFEFCEDFYGPYSKAPTDGSAQRNKQSNDTRVRRGGSYLYDSLYGRSAHRTGNLNADYSTYNVGFRVAVDIADDSPVLHPK